jgi:hypothetical protein
MNLANMKDIVRRDLHDEDSSNYRWTDNELERHIAHAVKEFSGHLPLEQKAVIATVSGSRELDVAAVTGRVMVEAAEYPVDKFPRAYQQFSLWGDTLTLLGDELPDGSNAYIYYGKLHTLDASGSTVPPRHEDIIACGACAFAAVELAVFTVNRVNSGGAATPGELLEWGNQKLKLFRQDIKRLGRKNRVRIQTLYRPYNPIVSRTTDPGP